MDHKIKSDKIFFYTVLAIALIVTLLLLAEVVIDLRSTSPAFLIPFLVGFSIILILYKKKFNPAVLASANLVLLFTLIEANVLRNPTTFHAVVYWMGFIPIIAIITTGIRQSFFWMILVVLSIIGNGIYFDNIGYRTYTLQISIDAFIVAGIIFSFSLYASSFLLYRLLGNAYTQLKITSDELSNMHFASEQKKEKLGRFMEVIFGLSKNKLIGEGKIEEVLPMVGKLASDTLGNNRISIWQLEEGKEEYLNCLYAYDKQGDGDTIGILKQKDFPLYFAAIKGNHVIMAGDVYEDPTLEEFVEGYFKPLQIQSMLDAPFFIGNRVAGVICCENRIEKKEWIPEDLLFLQSLCDIISLTYKNKETIQFLAQIRTQNLELHGQRMAMEEMNHELSTINEMLEEKVKDRTSVLEAQNKQLTEYAFVNSHLLRAPLARILGLSYLLTQSIEGKEDQKLVNGLIKSSNELDSIIKKISELLYDGNNFSRQEVEEIIRKNLSQQK